MYIITYKVIVIKQINMNILQKTKTMTMIGLLNKD